ncbi:ABC transporter ATP-binding protein [Paenarthrobacter sp. DKR-5]|uniref:ABC transporter ATP-binding protein n=1 Tax=Paenarthrobacter sp. DKR-5 TaxID=2835535 RepID=UPI001BDD7DC0|nr:ABC transporter ATP-binding protein [Paenarthrobacter sp. DKR-5]MBT1003573.1 ABC transporter ATP-binding protein [Paenarthrobacter sp. DKR-5]
MLNARSLHFAGRHGDLVPPTDLEAAGGEVLLVAGDGQESRTALSLLLSGRMKPTSGSAGWGNGPQPRGPRRHSALIDSPAVNAPERHLRVRDLAAEDLSLIPAGSGRRPRPGAWLKDAGFAGLANSWTDELDGGDRFRLLTALALADPRVDLLVLDSPDRHGAGTGWLAQARDLAAAERALCVVAVVASIPAGWDGPSARLGNGPAPTEEMTA